MRGLVVAALLLLGACATAVPPPPAPNVVRPGSETPVSAATVRAFAEVLERMEPVTGQECRRRMPRGNCDFLIILDTGARQPANAFQTIDRQTGRPVLVFTLALLQEVRNADEMAFIIGHEAAHHILGHIPRRQDSARSAAVILGTLATLGGADARTVREAQMIGAEVASRRYSRDFELEADALGTELAWLAGYDPLRGAAYFTRIPDPTSHFLATHPPNAQRMDVVRAAHERLIAQGPRGDVAPWN